MPESLVPGRTTAARPTTFAIPDLSGLAGRRSAERSLCGSTSQVAFPQQQLLDLGLHPFTEQRTIRQDDRAATVFLEPFFHDERQEHVGRFPSAEIGGAVGAHTFVFQAAKGRICDHAIDSFGKLPIVPTYGQRVAMLELAWAPRFRAAAVGHTEQVGGSSSYREGSRRSPFGPRRPISW